MALKEEVMLLWVDKLENHHRKLNAERKNIVDELYADVMKQTRTFIKNKGWDETKSYMSGWIEKATGTERMGSYHMRNAYLMVVDKMNGLENKSEMKLNKELEKLVSKPS